MPWGFPPILQKLDKDAVFVMLTADHIIEPADFQKLMEIGFRLVETDKNRLVTFSIKPTYPSTGFGYVERQQDHQRERRQGKPIAGPGLPRKRFCRKPISPGRGVRRAGTSAGTAACSSSTPARSWTASNLQARGHEG